MTRWTAGAEEAPAFFDARRKPHQSLQERDQSRGQVAGRTDGLGRDVARFRVAERRPAQAVQPPILIASFLRR